MNPEDIYNARHTAMTSRSHWNMNTCKFFTMGMTALGLAGLNPSLSPVLLASAAVSAIGCVGAGYLAQQNQKASDHLRQYDAHAGDKSVDSIEFAGSVNTDIQAIVHNIKKIAHDATVSDLVKGIPVIHKLR